MKMKLIILLVAILPSTLLAKIGHAPANFKSPEGYAIFVDFKKADYDLTYDPGSKTVTAKSTITFENTEEGMPVIDMVENPIKFFVDGTEVSTKVINSIDQDTWFRIILKSIKPGVHTFVVTSVIDQGVNFITTGVSSSFWFNDLGDRNFLEAYLPANFEYDQVKMTFNIDFQTMDKQKFYTNGNVTDLGSNRFTVEFPETYTSSSLYYHTTPIGRYPENKFTYTTLDGRDIPGVVYAKDSYTNLEDAKKKIISSIQVLESKYGPWLHQKIIVFIAGNGGMEYCGATMTDLSSLNHELTHSYFARGGFMPANGNAGWIDEAVTTWSDSGSGTRPDLKGIAANMAGNSQYRRYTEYRAYTQGASFMSYLNYKFQSNGGLTAFLNDMIKNDAFKPMTTEEFAAKMSTYYSEDLTSLFKDHVYTNKTNPGQSNDSKPGHMKMSIPEMNQYL
ncbi:hypothetical protein SHI21_14220 [Bacteriovorax sp. PP10]|uniref:Peptidase M1 membrane alanine aminopeptidase domain-containing protein n=1 Tax=Bacteriovorax antarcticus TaxID=3088717 RepID=A0ABU5VWE8_9BACT|nr:hypothetical protein [Bacteriovorax sp. PP10]MEA9357378.1 hypothetical protein [Bacteriovorax sp. PP10]